MQLLFTTKTSGIRPKKQATTAAELSPCGFTTAYQLVYFGQSTFKGSQPIAGNASRDGGRPRVNDFDRGRKDCACRSRACSRPRWDLRNQRIAKPVNGCADVPQYLFTRDPHPWRERSDRSHDGREALLVQSHGIASAHGCHHRSVAQSLS